MQIEFLVRQMCAEQEEEMLADPPVSSSCMVAVCTVVFSETIFALPKAALPCDHIPSSMTFFNQSF